MKKIYKFIRKILNKDHHLKGGWSGLSILPKVDNLIDVGIGQQGTPGLYYYFPNSRKIFVDPLIECRSAVKNHLEDNSSNIFIETALSDSVGEANIFVRNPLSGSGMMSKCEDDSGGKDREEKERRVKMTTLDSLIKELNILGSYGIKIDCEGAELKILKGGQKCLKKASFVIIEVPIGKDRFKNSYTFEDAIIFMSSNNYSVVAIRTSGDGTSHGDVAFMNKNI